MMWDSPLYTMNMFYYHWLIKKLLWPIAGQYIARLQEIYIERELAESEKHHVAAEGNKHPILSSKPQPHADTQNNRNGLICGAGEIAQRLRVLVALPEVLSSIFSNHIVAHNHL